MTSVRKIGGSVEGAGRVAVQGHAFAGRDRRKQDSQFLGRNLDLGPSEFEVGTLAIDP